MKRLTILIAASLLVACDSRDDSDDPMGNTFNVDTTEVNEGSTEFETTGLPAGVQSGESLRNVAETKSALETSLNSAEPVGILAQIDHQANAANVELELRPTRVTLFGNPALGTPLMQVNQLAGLDLPQKMFIWEDAEGQAHIAYNSAEYLSGRHDLAEAQESLDTINNALNMFAATAAGQEVAITDVTAPESGEGIIIVPSENDMDTTFNTLVQTIENAAPLTLVSTLDHSANAERVGLTLDPTRLVIFGNPNLGSPLMQSGQTIGIDLPQKMLVFQDADGQVSVAYNDPAYLAQRHGITDQDEIIATITQALGNLAAGATTAE